MQNPDDDHYMQLALRLARKGLGKTSPNPMVGAVIVKNGKIISQGYHKQAGSAHAEIEAIQSATESVQGSTLYVNLEPHGYVSKTLPCTEAIIKAGIVRVVCSTLDPNPKVAGDGLVQLKKAGIQVNIGLLANEAQLLNEQFFTFHQKQRPFIAIKYAASLDGKMTTSTGDSKWITDERARAVGRKLRGQYQAILVGINTVIADDPHLGTRIKSRPDPLRVILGSTQRVPLNAKILRDDNVLFFEGKLENLMAKLYQMGVISILVEGGASVIGDFVDYKLVDRVYGFYAPIIIGNNDKLADSLRLQKAQLRHYGDDVMIEGAI